MPPLPARLTLALALVAALAACEPVPAPQTPADPAAPPAATTPSPPAAAATPPAAPAAPRAGLTREGVQTVTLDLRNGTDSNIVELNAVEGGREGPNLLPAGMAIPPGGTYPLPVAVGRYLLRAELQAPSVFAPPRAVLRHVIVPRFPPNPPPRMPVTLR